MKKKIINTKKNETGRKTVVNFHPAVIEENHCSTTLWKVPIV